MNGGMELMHLNVPGHDTSVFYGSMVVSARCSFARPVFLWKIGTIGMRRLAARKTSQEVAHSL